MVFPKPVYWLSSWFSCASLSTSRTSSAATSGSYVVSSATKPAYTAASAPRIRYLITRDSTLGLAGRLRDTNGCGAGNAAVLLVAPPLAALLPPSEAVAGRALDRSTFERRAPEPPCAAPPPSFVVRITPAERGLTREEAEEAGTFLRAALAGRAFVVVCACECCAVTFFAAIAAGTNSTRCAVPPLAPPPLAAVSEGRRDALAGDRGPPPSGGESEGRRDPTGEDSDGRRALLELRRQQEVK